MAPAANMPAAEVGVDEPLVRALLVEQHPDLAALPLSPLAFGWDNAVFRLGDELAVRLPRRALAAALVEHEQRWLPVLAPRLPLPVPLPVRAGRPSPRLAYPWSWSVCPWLPGVVAGERPPDDLAEAGRVLGAFVRALHAPAPADAPVNPYRGVPLGERDPSLREWLERLGDAVDGAAALARWEGYLDTPPWNGPPLWLHGDLHPANVLVHEGHVAAVIDFGDLTSGDPASDLFIAWMLFPDVRERRVFRDGVGDVDDDTWSRAEGWALLMAFAYLANSADNPLMTAIGHRTLAALDLYDV